MRNFLSLGSGPGIGQATAERFGKEGFRVIMTSRDTKKLAARAARLRDKGYVVEAKPVDAGDIASIIALIRGSEAQFGGTDVLHFNSASTFRHH